jgi:hypothetical protein
MAFPDNFFFHNLEKLKHNISLLYYVNEELQLSSSWLSLKKKLHFSFKDIRIFPFIDKLYTNALNI